MNKVLTNSVQHFSGSRGAMHKNIESYLSKRFTVRLKLLSWCSTYSIEKRLTLRLQLTFSVRNGNVFQYTYFRFCNLSYGISTANNDVKC